MTTAIILPIQGSVDPGFLAGLAALRQSLTGAGAASERAGQQAESSRSAWERSANAFNEAHQAVSTIAAAITGAIARVGALSDEQARLDATSRRLGLDLDEGAAAAGRFVDETAAMGVASQFAARDIRLSQTELNNLMRVAGATAATLGTDVAGAADRLAQSLIRGEAEGLSPFGGSLVTVAGGAHTVGERLAAMGVRAGEVAAATDTATTRMERFKDSLEDGQRLMAHAFVDELARLSEVGTGLQGINTDAESFNTTLRAAGQTAASMVTRTVLGVGIIGGAIGTVLGGLTGMVQLAAAATHGLAAFNAERDRLAREGLSAESWRFVQSAADRLEALDADEGPRTTAAPTPVAVAAARPGAADAAARNRRQSGGGGGARSSAADMTFTAEQAASEEQAARIRDLEDLAGLAHDRAQARIDEEINGRLRAERAANDTLEAQKQAAQDALDIAAQEDRALRERLEAHERFTGRLAELNSERVHGAQRAAEFTNAAFDSMGKAIGTHVQALVDGRESVGAALQGMLSDTLISVGKEAVIQGGMEIAKGFAALAGVVTAPLAPGHFAAGAAFMAVGAAAGVAGAALAPSAAAPSGAAAGRAAAGGLLNDRPSNAGEGMAPVTINYFAPVIGGREATDSEIGTRFDRYDDAARARLRRAA